MSDVNDMYHTCRWCKHYKTGLCYRGVLTIDEETPIWQVAESGKLSELIEECLGDLVSEDCKQELDEKISVLYQSFDYDNTGVLISDPDNFYCKEWE